MGLDDLHSAKLSVPAVFLGIIEVPILYVYVYGIKTQNNSVLVKNEKSSPRSFSIRKARCNG